MSVNRLSSEELFRRSLRVMPGGVSSPVRSFRAVGSIPPFISHGQGPLLFDVDGKSYLDFVCSWGALILGHSNPKIVSGLIDALHNGTSFGASTALELELAELLCELLPGVEMIRFVNSGTEATMTAVRLARAFTGRDRIIKCNGCYHGHADSFLVEAGSGVATLGIAGSRGVPESLARLTSCVEFNDLSAMATAIDEVGSSNIAAIIVEPVPGNMGLVLPKPGYLEGLRSICDHKGILLIFDEVMSGFRVAIGGAAKRFGVTPDLATYGKVIGGGLPVGAIGGRRDIMEYLAPQGPVYQAGTLSGNPLAMTAGLLTIRELIEHPPYVRLEGLANRLTHGLSRAGGEFGFVLQTYVCGGMFGFSFNRDCVTCYRESKLLDRGMFLKFFVGMLNRGVYFAPSAFEAGFLSTAHTEIEVDLTIEKARETFADMSERID